MFVVNYKGESNEERRIKWKKISHKTTNNDKYVSRINNWDRNFQ